MAPQTENAPEWSITEALAQLPFEDSAVQPTFIPTPEKPRVVYKKSVAILDNNGFCVDYVQAHGFAQYSGNAVAWKAYINTASPSAGDAIVLKEGGVYGHVAIVQNVSSNSLQLIEQNYKGRYIISSRSVPLDYDRIVGFISPPVASSSQDLLPR